MSRSTVDAVLQGPGDLESAEVTVDIPDPGDTFLVRGLPAAYSNEAASKAREIKMGPAGEQIWTINTGKLEVLQFAHGVVEPQFTVQQAEVVAQKYGPMFAKVVAEIDRLSGFDKAAVEEAQSRFPDGGAGPNGAGAEDATAAGSGGPAVPARDGAGTQDDGRGA